MRPVLVAALVAAALAAASATSATGLHRNGVIAFANGRDVSQIYESNPDGSNPVRLTDEGVDARWPALSPDGTKLAYAAKQSGNWDVFVKPAGAGPTVDVSSSPGFDGYPDWSPDGTKLAYAGEGSNGRLAIMIHDFTTGTTSSLTAGTALGGDNWHPRWSPDGAWIAFACVSNGVDVCAMRTDGSKTVSYVTSDPGWELDPTWSPDGTSIAYVSYPYSVADIFVIPFAQGVADKSKVRDITNTPTVSEIQPSWSAGGIAFRAEQAGWDQVYLVRPDGSDLRKLSPGRAFEGDPNWSRDGSKLVFMSGRNARFDIAATTSETGARPLTRSPGIDSYPAWSADGRRLAFARSATAGRQDIFVMSAAGKGLRNLTRGRGLNWAPSWSPDGRHIAFVRFESFGAQLWEMNADGSGQRALTTHGSWNVHPSWSPDGEHIVYQGVRSGPAGTELSDLFVLDVRTLHVRRLTTHPYAEWPSWSPDGTLIAFDSGDQVWLVRPDGAGLEQLTHASDPSTEASWSPDATQVVFVRDQFFGHDTDLYSIRRDGTGERVVSALDTAQQAPSWQPAP